jgi:hypothetical protein
MPAEYAVYICEACRDEPSGDCGDACAMPWADELPPQGLELPTCRHCGRSAQLVTPLAPVA